MKASLTALTSVDLVFLLGLNWVNQETNKIIVASCHIKSKSKTIFLIAKIAFLVPSRDGVENATKYSQKDQSQNLQSFLRVSQGRDNTPQFFSRSKLDNASSKDKTIYRFLFVMCPLNILLDCS